jgi:hypothetical protein
MDKTLDDTAKELVYHPYFLGRECWFIRYIISHIRLPFLKDDGFGSLIASYIALRYESKKELTSPFLRTLLRT